MTEQSGESNEVTRPPRVFVSYAHGPDDDSVRRFWEFLRTCGIDAILDLPAAEQRRDWPLWMGDQIRLADFILVIASPAYRARAEGRSESEVGRGVQWEAGLIRDAFYRDQHVLDRFVPVVLPGQSRDGVPDFLAPVTSTVYFVSEYTVAGMEPLLRLLTGQPGIIEPPLGQVPMLGTTATAANRTPRRKVPEQSGRIVHNTLSGNVVGNVVQAGSIGSVVYHGPGAPQEAPARSKYAVGVGVRGWKSPFQRAGQQVAVGEPSTDVEHYGPGVRQEFDRTGWVLCGLPDGRTAAVSESVWDALHVAGSGALLSGPLDAVGFPVSRRETIAIVDDDATCVELDGGEWGQGRLWRSNATQDWEWQPKSDRFSGEMTHNARNWTGESPPPQLRIRAIASLLVAGAHDWEITTQRRRVFETALPYSHLAGALTVLSDRRGAHLPASLWVPGPHDNRPDRASYSWQITAPNGDLALAAEVLLVAGDEVVTCAELRIYDEAAWKAAIIAAGGTPPDQLQPALPEVREFLIAAWQMATVNLLELIAFPTSGPRWREVPHVEFRLTAERAGGVAEFVDLSDFGPTAGNDHREMAVTIPAVPYLADDLRRTLTRQALAYLGRNFGYLEATVDRL